MRLRTTLVLLAGFLLFSLGASSGQVIPDVHCVVEDYPVRAIVAWQFPETLSKVQVVVLRDPAGEQEARFDLLHGASSVLRTVLATLLRPTTWLAAGIRTSGRTVRLAVAMPSSNFPSGKV